MSNRIFQNAIHQMSDSFSSVVGVIDETCNIVACSNLSRIGELLSCPVEEVFIPNTSFSANGYSFHSFGNPASPDFAVFIEGVDEDAQKYANILAQSLGCIKQFYDEKFDKTNFIKNVMTDNCLPGEIFERSHELHLDEDASRAVLLLRLNEPADIAVFDLVRGLFPYTNRDFVVNINDTDIALIKEVRPDTQTKVLELIARSIVDALGANLYANARVGIGTIIVGIKDIARSYKEAQTAISVSKVFATEKVVVSYDNLGIARLIYQLPVALCESFLNEIFRRDSIESLDQETLFTIHKFFENNLNVSETSRKLFVHRNTLVYRLEKIRNLTGLDLREFDDAIVFKIALMVKKYLDTRHLS